MAELTYEEFLKMTEKKNKNTPNSSSGITYFGLKEDGETAIVRFNISKMEDIKLISCHYVKVNGKMRKISCLKHYGDDNSVCPLCASGQKPNYRCIIQLLVYENTDKGIEAKPVIWEQSIRTREMLKSYIMDYGDLREMLFKITRHGKKGDTGTSYSIVPANTSVYVPSNYPADFKPFENANLSWVCLNKTKEELEEFVETGEFPVTSTNNTPNQTTTTSVTSKPVEHTTTRYVEEEKSEPIRTTVTDSVSEIGVSLSSIFLLSFSAFLTAFLLLVAS